MSKWILEDNGSIASSDYKHLIKCLVNDNTGRDVSCNETAKMVCNRLNTPNSTKERVEAAQRENPEDSGTGLCTMREVADFMLEQGSLHDEFVWHSNGKKLNVEVIITKVENHDHC